MTRAILIGVAEREMHDGRSCLGVAGRPVGRYRWIAVPLMAAFVAGCQEYNWRRDFARAEQEAREQGKDLFIFYKWWLDSDSNDMLANELSAPEVKALFQDTINLLLDKDFGPAYVEYVRKYGVTSYPTSVIVRPDGTYKVQPGRIPKNEFIAWVKAAKSPPAAPEKEKKPPAGGP